MPGIVIKLLNFCIFSYFSLSVLPFYIKKRREAGSGKHGNRVRSFTVIGAKDDRRARICAKNSADLGADLHQEQRGFERGSVPRTARIWAWICAKGIRRPGREVENESGCGGPLEALKGGRKASEKPYNLRKKIEKTLNFRNIIPKHMFD